MVFPSIAWPANMAGGAPPEDLPGSVRPVSPSGYLSVSEMHVVAGSDGAVLQEATGLAEVLGDAGSLIGSLAGSDGSERSSIQSTTATGSKADSPDRGSPVADGDQEAFAPPQKASAPPSPPSGPLFVNDDAEEAEGPVKNPSCWQRCYKGLMRALFGDPAPAPVSSTVPAVEMVSAKVGTVPNPLRKRLKDGEVDPRNSLALVMARSHIHRDGDADAKGGRPSIVAYGPQPSMRTMERRSVLAKTYGPRRSTVAGLQETLEKHSPGTPGSPGVVSNPLNVAAGVGEDGPVTGQPKVGAKAPGGGDADALEDAEAGARAKPAKPKFTPEEEKALRAFSHYVTTSIFPDKPSMLEWKRRVASTVLSVVLGVGFWAVSQSLADRMVAIPALAYLIATVTGFNSIERLYLATKVLLILFAPYYFHVLHGATGHVTTAIEQNSLVKTLAKKTMIPLYVALGVYSIVKGALPAYADFDNNVGFSNTYVYAVAAPWAMGVFNIINVGMLVLKAFEENLLHRLLNRKESREIADLRLKLATLMAQANWGVRKKGREQVIAFDGLLRDFSRQAKKMNMETLPPDELPGINAWKELIALAGPVRALPPSFVQKLRQHWMRLSPAGMLVLLFAGFNGTLNYKDTLLSMESFLRSVTQGLDLSYKNALDTSRAEVIAHGQAATRQAEENAISAAWEFSNRSYTEIADLLSGMVPDDEYYLGNYADPCYEDFRTAIVFPHSTPPTNDDEPGMLVQFPANSSLGKPLPLFPPFNYTGMIPYPSFTGDPSIDAANGYNGPNCISFNDAVRWVRTNPSYYFPYQTDFYFFSGLLESPYSYLAIPNNGTLGYTLGNLTTVNNVTTPVVEPLAPWAEGLAITTASGSGAITGGMSVVFGVLFAKLAYDLFAPRPLQLRPGGGHRIFNGVTLGLGMLYAAVWVSPAVSEGLVDFNDVGLASALIAGSVAVGMATFAGGFREAYATAFEWMQRGFSDMVSGIRRVWNPSAAKPVFSGIKRAKHERNVAELQALMGVAKVPLITGLDKLLGAR